MIKTEVVLLRSDGLGLTGTVNNAEHHAEELLPFITAMRDEVSKLGFKTWKMGSNVHEFVTEDGARYTLRAYTRGGQYRGVRLSKRLSRSSEEHLVDTEFISEVGSLLDFMRKLARGKLGDNTPLLSCAKA